jgi:hypothetical protein
MPQARKTLQMDQSEDEDEEGEVTLVVGGSRSSGGGGGISTTTTTTTTSTTEAVNNKLVPPKVRPAPGVPDATRPKRTIQTPHRFLGNKIPRTNIRRPIPRPSPQWILSKLVRGRIPPPGGNK